MEDQGARPALPTPQRLQPAVDLLRRLLEELDALLFGQTELHRMMLVALLGRGHVLLEGVPGVGKTTLVKALASLLDLSFNRVQFTPDLMPGDILGMHILAEGGDGRREMRFQPGPVFTHLLLADEINRASPKTQSALLEAMQERSVTLLGSTRPLPQPFLVLASQNPIELEGTYPLPEAQLDRFLFKLTVGGCETDVLERIVSLRRRGEPPAPGWTATRGELDLLFEIMEAIYLPRAVCRYIARLVAATHAANRAAPDPVRQYVSYGASPRAAIALGEAARGLALLAGRPSAGFEDVRAAAPAVLEHRIILNYRARYDQVEPRTVVQTLLAGVAEADDGLPRDIQVGRERHP